MNENTLKTLLGEEKLNEIQEKARSFIHGSRIQWKEFDTYLRSFIYDDVQIIDTKTGEILDPIYLYKPEVVAARNAFFEKKEIVEKGKGKDARGHHFNMIRDKNLELKESVKMGDREKILLLTISQFKNYDFNGNGKWFTTEELCEIWNVTENTCNNIRSRLKQNGVLISKPVDSHAYIYSLSEKYFYIGKNNGKEFSKLYFNKLNEVIKDIKCIERNYVKRYKKKLKYSAIATLHGMLPYFHKETNYLSKNPMDSILKKGETIFDAYEREAKLPAKKRKLKFMGVGTLSKQLGTSTELLNKHIKTLQEADAIMITKNKGTQKILVHPLLMLSQDINMDDAYMRKMCADFNMHIPTEEELLEEKGE